MLVINLNFIKKYNNNKKLDIKINTAQWYGIKWKRKKDTVSWLKKIINLNLQESIKV
jgi:hypothetical protein